MSSVRGVEKAASDGLMFAWKLAGHGETRETAGRLTGGKKELT
jgi:hypothetical protein